MDTSNNTSLHTIVGAGQVGLKLARLLAAEGHRVRLVRRGAAGETIAGVTWMQGDATDAAFLDKACAGADVVYNCTNPPDYAGWDGVLQPLYRAIWSGAARAGARLVQLDNLYMVGRPPESPFDESTPHRPCSKKGEIRKALTDELMAMHERGELNVVIARASDYFGPGTPGSTVVRPDVLAKVRTGGTVYVFGDPDMPHAYTYSPDVARGLAVLGTHSGVTGRVWHLPTTAQGTTRELLHAFADVAGTKVRVRSIPDWLLRGAGVFSPLMSAIAEMTYQWHVPYVLDDSDFRRTFGVEPTPLKEAIAATLAEGEDAVAVAA